MRRRIMSMTVTGAVTHGVVVPSSAREFLESLPAGPRAFKTWEEYERHLKKGNGSLDR